MALCACSSEPLTKLKDATWGVQFEVVTSDIPTQRDWRGRGPGHQEKEITVLKVCRERVRNEVSKTKNKIESLTCKNYGTGEKVKCFKEKEKTERATRARNYNSTQPFVSSGKPFSVGVVLSFA